MSGQNCSDEQYQAGVNAATFWSHLHAHARKTKGGAIPIDRHARDGQQPIGGISGAMLEETLEAALQKSGQRNHEREKRERERKGAQEDASENDRASAREKSEEGKG